MTAPLDDDLIPVRRESLSEVAALATAAIRVVRGRQGAKIDSDPDFARAVGATAYVKHLLEVDE